MVGSSAVNGKLKALGLTLLVSLALGAAAADGAAAGVYTFGSSPTIEGTQVESSEFESSLGVVKCGKTTLSGTGEGSEAPELMLTPSYSECKFGGFNATIDVNGCKYTLAAPTETGQSPPADMHAEMRIVKCAKAMEITTAFCTIKIGEQTPGTPTTDLSNTAAEPALKARISPTVKGIAYSYSGFGCGTGSAANGVYRGGIEATGFFVLANPWVEAKNNGGPAKEGPLGVCEFAAVGQTCLMQISNLTFRTLAVVKATLEGTNANVRYKRAVEGCVLNVGLPCEDKLEAIKIEAKTVNDYCIVVKDQGTGEFSRRCFAIAM
jgi:hypothetical protein